MQEQLHVGRPSWKRTAIPFLILFGGMIAPFVLGLHWRKNNFVIHPTGDPASYSGDAVWYKGLFTLEIYGVTSNQSPPLFILVGPIFRHRNIEGMKWLEEKS